MKFANLLEEIKIEFLSNGLKFVFVILMTLIVMKVARIILTGPWMWPQI